MLLISGTRAVQLLKGLFFVITVGFAARILQLNTVVWFLDRFFSVLVVAIPIVFQPELRRILEDIGSGNLWKSNIEEAEAQKNVEEIIKTLLYCKNERIGALIVLQRDVGLKDYWQHATALHAPLTYELLVTIFWPGTPLHDGAVIVDRGEITAAACYLPLTEKTNISRWLGTRHRAGIGITEVTDAHVLIVSEEKGEISLAVRGRLSRGLKENQLRKLLVHYYMPSQERTGIMASFNRAFKINKGDEEDKGE